MDIAKYIDHTVLAADAGKDKIERLCQEAKQHGFASVCVNSCSKNAILNGADEIDMVINIGYMKSGMYDEVLDDIKAVRKASEGKTLKVIIETCLLTDDEKRKACELSEEAGADFVKTSTGFSTGGATVEDVALMRSVVGDRLGVKASGGIRDYRTAKAMIEAGATRIGASSGIRIVEEQNADN